MRYLGLIIDRTLTPYIINKNLATNAIYAIFPFYLESNYQQGRYYADERRIDVISLEEWKEEPSITKFPLV